jgi:hypothetical protein
LPSQLNGYLASGYTDTQPLDVRRLVSVFVATGAGLSPARSPVPVPNPGSTAFRTSIPASRRRQYRGRTPLVSRPYEAELGFDADVPDRADPALFGAVVAAGH